MHQFKVGDKVKIRRGISALARGNKKDNILYAQHHGVDPDAVHTVHYVHDIGTIDLIGVGVGFWNDRLEFATEKDIAWNRTAEVQWKAYAQGRNNQNPADFMAGWAACERAKVAAMFDRTIATARKTDPATSQEAATKVRMKAGVIRDLIIHHLTVHGGLTGTELAQKIGVPRDSVSPRIPQLVKAGRVEANGRRNGQAIYIRVL